MCWAYTLAANLEISFLQAGAGLFDLSEEHLAYFFAHRMNDPLGNTANDKNEILHSYRDGGNQTLAAIFLSTWSGMALESQVPYETNADHTLDSDKVPSSQMAYQTTAYLENAAFSSYSVNNIKSLISEYGSVSMSFGMYDTYYNPYTYAYSYPGSAGVNHAITLIGWDDNYSRSNFNTPLEGDGAFICQNSWGDGFGENGIFYVSYYDTNIGTHNVAYTRADDVHNYDHIYQSDLCGWVGKLGYDSDQIYGANVFEAKGSETLSAASFYATGANTQYEVYVVHDFENEKSFAQREQLASGTLQKAGYYTVDFDTKVSLKKGERYAVLVYLKTPGTKHPMAIEYDTGEKILQGVDLDDGEGYISLNGKNFVNVKEKKDCNLCIKAFTRD